MTERSKRFTLQVGEIFPIEEGLNKISHDLQHSRKARISNLRPDLTNRFLESIRSHLGNVEVFAHTEEHLKDLKFNPKQSAACKSRWYQNFLGNRVCMGEVLMPTALYHVLWTDEKIHRVFGVTDPAYLTFMWKKNFMMRLEDEQIFSTVYDREEGLEVIRKKAETSSVFRLLVLPPALVRQLIPSVLRGDFQIILSRRDPLARKLLEDPDVRVGSDAKIFMIYGGEECTVGSIRLNHELFSIMWRQDKVFAVMKYDNLIFANYFGKAFDTAWKYSKKPSAD